MNRFHSLPLEAAGIEPPQLFTYPFCYQPHPLCVLAAKQVRVYLNSRPEWKDELSRGKMLGVLIVQQSDEMGFLAAFSGTLDSQTQHEYFVPPVFDLMASGCYFQEEQDCISALNHRVEELKSQLQPSLLKEEADRAIRQVKDRMQEAKSQRDLLRHTLTPEELETRQAEFIRESQFLRAEVKRTERLWAERLKQEDAANALIRQQITDLMNERRQRSVDLQQWLFRQFTFLNANGLEKSLLELFHPFAPPSGAGDCCAPRLLQFAFRMGYKPLCMAEFWVGASPRDIIRVEGQYYEACRSKCRPILTHMLQGLDVEPNPLLRQHEQLVSQLQILHVEESFLIVNKPSGMLSVPGLDDLPSVQSVITRRFPCARMVHRLDMDTSGLMVIALTDSAYHNLQDQFLMRMVHKSYRALLEHPMSVGQEGDIQLPLCPDYQDRPRQMVDSQMGKPAHTHYRVLSNEEGHALVELTPHTGRTHQLRVHCAHTLGLNNPIVGDRLYGHAGERLMLHARELTFLHPQTGQRVRFIAEF